MSKIYLIEIAIGPVQDFIASARKLCDLWFGSYVLSELSKATAQNLAINGCELIFPAVDKSEIAVDLKPNSELIVANKILASYQGEKDPRQLVADAKSVWRKKLNKMAEDTLSYIRKDHDLELKEDLFRAQIDDIGEFFGVWTSLDQSGYAKARDRVEQLLAGRKNLREFNAPSWSGAGLPKNSLDGLRESALKNSGEIQGLLKLNEQLDAMGCVKRFYPLTQKMLNVQFDDLAQIAIRPWLKAVENQGLKKPEWPSGKPLSGEEFFDEANLDLLRALIKKPEIGPLTKYACLLLGDGDKMGAAIGEISTPEGHKRFSKVLSKFANDARSIIEEHEGSLVYAGGDDVLAYVPLHTALSCGNSLRRQFKNLMAGVCRELGLRSDVPTFSIGMSIVHYQEPLSSALNTVRKAETIAKNKGGRNALALIQDKRSGSPIVAVGKWDTDEGLPGIAERLSNWIELYRKQDDVSGFSARLGYQLREASRESGDEMKFEIQQDRLVPQNAAAAFVLRIFHQKEAFRSMEKAKLHEWEVKLFRGYKSIRQLADELVIAHQFAILPVYGKE
ncbi:MAG: type III-B CRISPR-associated protein Cas10/Cmr2 [Spirochaetales bacterium]|nr:type III-B CRISPR-associated protein Cas10/Cmr2 [Spirochaetales bacterium]